jgi:hypothetical protein
MTVLNPLPFQYTVRAPMIERMRNETMRTQLAEDHDRELEDFLGRIAPSAWTTATLGAAWTPYPTFGPVGYRMVGDDVELRGVARLIVSGTGGDTTILTLPVGMRTPYALVLPAPYGEPNGVGRVDVGPDGIVRFTSPTPTDWVSLAGIRFSVTP